MTTRYPLKESSPNAQIARFDDWRDVPFELAYVPGSHDKLKYSLGPNYQAPPFSVPFANPDGNSSDGRLYGTNDIPIRPMAKCEPFVNSCCPGPWKTRAPDQGPLTNLNKCSHKK